MPRFRPIARYTTLPELLTDGRPVPPLKIAEPNPRRRFAYCEHFSGTAITVFIGGDLAPRTGDLAGSSGGDGVGIPDDAFAFAQDQNPLVLNYAGVLSAIKIGAAAVELSVAELVDDVDHRIEDTLRFRTRFFSASELVAQPGPDFQPIKVFEPGGGALRFVHLVSTVGNVTLVPFGTPFKLGEGFRLPTQFPLFFRHPFLPTRALFAADTSGGGGRLRVVTGLA